MDPAIGSSPVAEFTEEEDGTPDLGPTKAELCVIANVGGDVSATDSCFLEILLALANEPRPFGHPASELANSSVC